MDPRSLLVAASDEIVTVYRLVFVLTIDARIRHVVLRSSDTGVVVGDSKNIEDSSISCSRCSTPGHREDGCGAFGVVASPTLKRRRNKRRASARERAQPRCAA